MNAPDLRVSDAEREVAVDRLRAAAAEGRLDADELDERVSAAFSARTHGELTALLADLPPAAPAAPARTAPAVVDPDAPPRAVVLRQRTASFVVPNFVCLAVWAATGAGSFWPGWVLLGTGIAFGVFLIRFLLGVEDAGDHRHRGHRHGHGGHHYGPRDRSGGPGRRGPLPPG
jgi:hypothetical protein